MQDFPCGNTCSLLGIDIAILKQGTIIISAKAHTIRSMKYSISPVVRVALYAKKSGWFTKISR